MSADVPDGPAGGAPADRPGPAPSAALQRARRALAEAKADAAARGVRPSPGSAGKEAERLTRASRPRRDDPQSLAQAIDRLLTDRGWRDRAAIGGVFGRWTEIVGPELAAHAHLETFTDGELTIVTDSTAWATQVRLLAADLVRRLNAELGSGMIRRVRVTGPAPPGTGAAGRGRWRVRGGRGPRDTYG